MCILFVAVALALSACTTAQQPQTEEEYFPTCASTASARVDELDEQLSRFFDYGVLPTKRKSTKDDHINMCEKFGEDQKLISKFNEDCCSGFVKDTVKQLVTAAENTYKLVCGDITAMKLTFVKLECLKGKEAALAKCADYFLSQMSKCVMESDLLMLPLTCKAIDWRTSCVKNVTETCSDDAKDLLAKADDNIVRLMAPVCKTAQKQPFIEKSEMVIMKMKKTPFFPFIKIITKTSHGVKVPEAMQFNQTAIPKEMPKEMPKDSPNPMGGFGNK